MFRQRLVKVSAEARGAYDAETGRSGVRDVFGLDVCRARGG